MHLDRGLEPKDNCQRKQYRDVHKQTTNKQLLNFTKETERERERETKTETETERQQGERACARVLWTAGSRSRKARLERPAERKTQKEKLKEKEREREKKTAGRASARSCASDSALCAL